MGPFRYCQSVWNTTRDSVTHEPVWNRSHPPVPTMGGGGGGGGGGQCGEEGKMLGGGGSFCLGGWSGGTCFHTGIHL